MENRRYDYSPIIRRRKIEWPSHGRVALWVAPNIEYFHFDMPIRGSGSNHAPDVPGYTLRDYGARVGVYRIMSVLDKYNIRASVLLNAEVCKQHPPIIEEGNKRNWEWLGHGMTNSVSMLDYPLEEERAIIHNVKEIIIKATGKAPKGWLGPGLGETFNTPDHLAAEGFEYVCDWANDEQPTPMRVKSGRMVVIPYDLGVNDILARGNFDSQQAIAKPIDVANATTISSRQPMRPGKCSPAASARLTARRTPAGRPTSWAASIAHVPVS
jgi:hypothetical protein